jgi:hypothetical protein
MNFPAVWVKAFAFQVRGNFTSKRKLSRGQTLVSK